MGFTLDVVPVGVLSSRSTVTWAKNSCGTHIPIVISPVVIDMCKGILNDSFVRSLFLSKFEIMFNLDYFISIEKDLNPLFAPIFRGY